MCAATPDQTTDTALKYLKLLGNTYGFPSEVCSDGGPVFRLRFEAELSKLGISHHTSPPYFPSSNGLAERGVGVIKSYLAKLGKLQQPELSKLLYRINNMPSCTPGAGSAFFRFFGRRGRISSIPQLHQQFIPEEVRLARVARENAQNDVATKRKRSGQHIFQLHDKVRVRNPASGSWDRQGIITDVISSQDGVIRSFMVKLDTGELLYRHQTYIRHMV